MDLIMKLDFNKIKLFRKISKHKCFNVKRPLWSTATCINANTILWTFFLLFSFIHSYVTRIRVQACIRLKVHVGLLFVSCIHILVLVLFAVLLLLFAFFYFFFFCYFSYYIRVCVQSFLFFNSNLVFAYILHTRNTIRSTHTILSNDDDIKREKSPSFYFVFVMLVISNNTTDLLYNKCCAV